MFTKILIANRGEIAIRIIRACKEMGIATVAVYSTADQESLHVAMADQCVCIGDAFPSESYLNMERIISAAIITNAEAIHPGYGFLSENSQFAALCKKHGITFIGPDETVISMMGDKNQARQLMISAGVPVIPGSEVVENVSDAVEAAKKIGYPLLIKARSGGGGKGIRLVTAAENMEQAFYTASKEAENSFGDGAVYLEKYISPARHIEVQILGDEAGTILCLGERECSIQKNNQKLIEESPSPVVDEPLRKKFMEAAIKAAKAANYVNAGTIEFLLDTEHNFYFMEMNVRLQVEHAVTELITGIDLVKWQIRIAAGVLLNFTQDEVQIRGSAIECRINASSVGKVALLHVPGGLMVRFDSSLWTGYSLPPYYDSMLGKLIVYANTREEAIRKMNTALCELVIDGVPNNIDSQMDIISDPQFCKGDYNTTFMNKRGEVI